MTNCTYSAVIALFVLSAIATPVGAAEQDLSVQIKALQRERVETLAKLVNYCKAEFAVGAMRCQEVIDAETDLIRAELDATDKPDERIALLTAHVSSQTQFLKSVEYRRQTETLGLANVYRARSMLSNTKIMLLQERRAQKAGGE
jgi:hypothetical protein